jgi:ribosomal protein L14
MRIDGIEMYFDGNVTGIINNTKMVKGERGDRWAIVIGGRQKFHRVDQ